MVIFDSPRDLNILLPHEQPLPDSDNKDASIPMGTLCPPIDTNGESSQKHKPYKFIDLSFMKNTTTMEQKLEALITRGWISMPPTRTKHPNNKKYCAYHQTPGHLIDECHALEKILKRLTQIDIIP